MTRASYQRHVTQRDGCMHLLLYLEQMSKPLSYYENYSNCRDLITTLDGNNALWIFMQPTVSKHVFLQLQNLQLVLLL